MDQQISYTSSNYNVSEKSQMKWLQTSRGIHFRRASNICFLSVYGLSCRKLWKIPSLSFLAFRNASSCFVCLMFFLLNPCVLSCFVTVNSWILVNVLFKPFVLSQSPGTDFCFCFVAILLVFLQISSNYICIALTSILATRAQPWSTFV